MSPIPRVNRSQRVTTSIDSSQGYSKCQMSANLQTGVTLSTRFLEVLLGASKRLTLLFHLGTPPAMAKGSTPGKTGPAGRTPQSPSWPRDGGTWSCHKCRWKGSPPPCPGEPLAWLDRVPCYFPALPPILLGGLPSLGPPTREVRAPLGPKDDTTVTPWRGIPLSWCPHNLGTTSFLWI